MLVVFVTAVVVLTSASGATATGVECSDVTYQETDDGYFEVDTLAQLQCIGHQNVSATLADDYLLVGDIDASATERWKEGFVPIGFHEGRKGNRTSFGVLELDPFRGEFDGNGHTITGLKIDQAVENPTFTTKPLVGMIALNNGTVTNLTVDDVDVAGNMFTGAVLGGNDIAGELRDVHFSGTVSGVERVGGPVGRNFGYIENASSTGTITGEHVVGGLTGGNSGLIVESTTSATVVGETRIGGFAGGNNGQIANSFGDGNVTGTTVVGGFVGLQSNVNALKYPQQLSRITSTGIVTGVREVGGLVGRQMRGTELLESYSRSTVQGQTAVGGLVGNNSGRLARGYAAGSLTGNQTVGGIAGLHDGGATGMYYDRSMTGEGSTNTGVGVETPGKGLPSSRMTGMNASRSMSALDFERIWTAEDGAYPALAPEAEELYRCGTVDESGVYELLTDPLHIEDGDCLEIRTDDVTVYGNNRTIIRDKIGSGITSVRNRSRSNPEQEVRNASAIKVRDSRAPGTVAVQNLTTSGWTCGLELADTHNGVFSGLTATDGDHGICLEHSDGNRLEGLTIVNTSASAVDVRSSQNNELVDTLVRNGGAWAVRFTSGQNSTQASVNHVTQLDTGPGENATVSFEGQNVAVGSIRNQTGNSTQPVRYFSASRTASSGELSRLRVANVPEFASLWQLNDLQLVGSGVVSNGTFHINTTIDAPLRPERGVFVTHASELVSLDIIEVDDSVDSQETVNATYRVGNELSVPTIPTVSIGVDNDTIETATFELLPGKSRTETVIIERPAENREFELQFTVTGNKRTIRISTGTEPDETSDETVDGSEPSQFAFGVLLLLFAVTALAVWRLHGRRNQNQ